MTTMATNNDLKIMNKTKILIISLNLFKLGLLGVPK